MPRRSRLLAVPLLALGLAGCGAARWRPARSRRARPTPSRSRSACAPTSAARTTSRPRSAPDAECTLTAGDDPTEYGGDGHRQLRRGDSANFDVEVGDAPAGWTHPALGMMRGVENPSHADLLVTDAELVATVDDARREIPGGWVAVTDGLVSGVGGAGDPPPTAARTIDARGCLVTPGLVNTHHHLYQNLTRAFAPALTGGLFDWLVTLYPLWARLDEEAAYVCAYVGLTELALGGCTTSTDHLYVHPRGAGDLISAEVERRPRPRHAVPPDPRLDVAVGEGRRPAAGLRRPGRRRDPGRFAAAGGGAPRPRPPRDDPDRARAVLAVQRLDVADEPRRPSWPSGSTSGCTPTSPRRRTRTSSAWRSSAAGRSTTSPTSAG